MKRRNHFLTLLLFLGLVSLVSLITDKETMGFYQLNAISLSSFSSLPLPAINQTTIIIVISILLVIIVVLATVWFLGRKRKKNNAGQEILTQAQEQARVMTGESPAQSIDFRLAQYIRDARVAGLTNEIIYQKLRDAGWPEETIRRAL